MSHLVRVLTVLTFLNVLIITLPLCYCTPLDDYVNKPDTNFKYSVITSFKGDNFTTIVLNMTSQQWMTESFVDRSIWWHYVCVTIPDKLDVKDTAFLYIDEGHNTDSIPTLIDGGVALTGLVAVSTGAIAIDLKQIPNQPVVFKNDPSKTSRNEDAVIAWTWSEYINNAQNPEVLLRMPMTKAAVRAMDAVSDFIKRILGANIDKFVVAGASKRGWTTWTTAAVDKRVVAFIPIVLDLLNLVQNMHHHFRSLGGWTFAFNDYYVLNFTAELDDPIVQEMANIIDPIVYTERYQDKPKLVISAGGDEFFLPDDSHYYWENMTEPKYVSTIKLTQTRIPVLAMPRPSLAKLHPRFAGVPILALSLNINFQKTIQGKPLPKLSWTRKQTSTGGRITLVTSSAPLTVKAYFAETLDDGRRDFRLLVGTPGAPTKPMFHPVIWFHTDVKRIATNTYEVEFDCPYKGWLAFFIETTFSGVGDTTLTFTTETMIIPDTFPFPDCHGQACHGKLV